MRNRVRRAFTVEAKSGGKAGYISIPSKQPREPRTPIKQPEVATLWLSLDAAARPPQALVEAVPEHRRILPSLLVAEVHEPEPAPLTEPEEHPRVHRVSSRIAPTESAPRRRGRPRKMPFQQAVAVAIGVVEQGAPEPPQPVMEPAPINVCRRPNRAGSEKLRLGERWKRRLPRWCW